MSLDPERLRVTVERKFQPPVNILLDPSLLAPKRCFRRLQDSQLFESRTQATFDGTLNQAPVEDIQVPGIITKLLTKDAPSDITETSVWEFFRGKARGNRPNAVNQFLDKHDIESFNPDPPAEIQLWSQRIQDSAENGRLGDALAEEYQFLESGGVMLSRTSKSIEMLRDAGVTTIDIGSAPLAETLEDQLERIGYPETASVCAFAVTDIDSTVDALSGDILTECPGMLLYKLGG